MFPFSVVILVENHVSSQQMIQFKTRQCTIIKETVIWSSEALEWRFSDGLVGIRHHHPETFPFCWHCCPCIVIFLFLSCPFPEHGQKFPGLRPADAAGLDGPQQKWAETGPGGTCAEASADWVQPRAFEECQTALRVTLPKNIRLACSTSPRRHPSPLLIPQLVPQCHLSGRRLPQWHFQTLAHSCSRGQACTAALLPNVGDTVATNRAKSVHLVWSYPVNQLLSDYFPSSISLDSLYYCFRDGLFYSFSRPEQWKTAGQSVRIWVNTKPSGPDPKCEVRA